MIKNKIKTLERENKKLKENLKDKVEEYEELKEKYKSICAGYCWTLSTDFD